MAFFITGIYILHHLQAPQVVYWCACWAKHDMFSHMQCIQRCQAYMALIAFCSIHC